MASDWYGKAPHSATVAIFGEVFDDQPPVTNNILFGQKAYEAFQVHKYLESLLQTRLHPTYIDWSPLFYALYAGIIATGAKRVIEMGSTLFATIDRLEKVQRLSRGPVLDLEYVGIEPSQFFCRVAEALHPAHRIVHVAEFSEVREFEASVTRCYQSTSYGFETTDELVRYCAASAFGSQGIWFSVDGTTQSVSILGKRLTLFSLPEFVGGMRDRGFKVEFVRNHRSIRPGDFDYCESWLVYHKFSPEQGAAFQSWLARLAPLTRENPVLYPEFDAAPVVEKTDLVWRDSQPGRGQLDFTTPDTLKRLEQWKAQQPKTARPAD